MGPRRLVGQRFIRLEVVSSTNEKAKEMLDENVEDGTVIVAERQTAGRGRHGRAWSSPPGGLYLSIVLRPEEKNVHLLSPLSGLPVVNVLKQWGITALLKWPNDVTVNGKKIAGILSEGVYRRDEFYAIVGIGVNTAMEFRRLPKDVQKDATTVRRESERKADNEEFLDRLLREYDTLYRKYAGDGVNLLVEEYRSLCSTLGRNVVIDTARGKVKGKTVNISAQGALVVEAEGKMFEVFEGTVRNMG